VRLVRRFTVPMQAFAFGLESLFLTELLDFRWARLLMSLAVAFHLAIFATSGILFLDWMVSNGLVVSLIASADAATLTRSFGVDALAPGTARAE
jgi:hypothetical protein